jgi:hypothetical protein
MCESANNVGIFRLVHLPLLHLHKSDLICQRFGGFSTSLPLGDDTALHILVSLRFKDEKDKTTRYKK